MITGEMSRYRKTFMDASLKAALLNRLQCIEGHSRGVRRMVEAGQDCAAILHQIKAMQGALIKVKGLLIKDYLTSELNPVFENGNPDNRETILEDFAKLLTEDGLK